jgi:hypothetical protein
MPFYLYKHTATGRRVRLMKTIAERDRVPGHQRVMEFPTGRLGLAENPHTMEYGVRQGMKDMENTYGRAEMARQMGSVAELKRAKEIWK